MSNLTRKFPLFVLKPENIKESLRALYRVLDLMYDNIVTAVNSKQDLIWTKFTANGVTLGDGPPTSSDTVADLRVAHDGNLYTVDEKSTSAGQNLIVDFTGVTAFKWVQILAYYIGQSGHEIQIQLEASPFDDSTWHAYGCVNPDHEYMTDYSFFVEDDSMYINSGVVKIRFLHSESGNQNDDWIFNTVALYR